MVAMIYVVLLMIVSFLIGLVVGLTSRKQKMSTDFFMKEYQLFAIRNLRQPEISPVPTVSFSLYPIFEVLKHIVYKLNFFRRNKDQ